MGGIPSLTPIGSSRSSPPPSSTALVVVLPLGPLGPRCGCGGATVRAEAAVAVGGESVSPSFVMSMLPLLLCCDVHSLLCMRVLLLLCGGRGSSNGLCRLCTRTGMKELPSDEGSRAGARAACVVGVGGVYCRAVVVVVVLVSSASTSSSLPLSIGAAAAQLGRGQRSEETDGDHQRGSCAAQPAGSGAQLSFPPPRLFVDPRSFDARETVDNRLHWAEPPSLQVIWKFRLRFADLYGPDNVECEPHAPDILGTEMVNEHDGGVPDTPQ
jgi:hypothetical protein